MARPRKRRRVCCLPTNRTFGPLDGRSGEDSLRMTVEEYETIRLIDFEGQTQEECAQNMEVARTTAQRIYAQARQKIAQLLVEGVPLIIEGGDYILCDRGDERSPCGRCRRRGYGHGRYGGGRRG
ncbi:MAG: DUF134 domain-containing protein [Limnochordia bacterium]|jgi:predicted DNA-binding protein (UPF0251 family)